MGFSSALQGKSAHDALLSRQDAELRLLEVMKRCLLQKVKCDKEYAIALTAAAQHGLKIDRADDLQGSQITKAWRSVMEEWEQTAKQFKSNAEFLESLCQDKLTHLYHDKRKARKIYQEEHQRIASQFTNITEDVARKKCEYQKHLEYYKLLRSKFEEHYIKAGRGGRKLDDVRDKYQKACRKLHLAHNEYVLLISEASEVDSDYRNVLLPGLLEHQQSIQEEYIIVWKNILQEALQYSDLTSNTFQDIQRRIECSLQGVNPSEEYREFTERHKTSPPPPIVFQFDQALIEDKDTLGKLQPNTLTVDNLTIDWLRNRLTELETTVKECQEKQTKMQIENGTSLGVSIQSSLTNGIGRKENNNRSTKDFTALRCHEKQILKLADLIKSALNEVGCEELPSGCDDISVDPSFIENNICNNDQQSASFHPATIFLRQKSNEVLSIIRAPFKRKATMNGGGGNNMFTGADVKSPKSASSSSNQASLVNLNESCVSLCTDSDASTSNIYTEIDVRNDSLTNDIINDMCASGDFTDYLMADVLKRLFNVSTESITADVDHINSTCNYANESIMYHMHKKSLLQQDLYEIDNIAGTANDDEQSASARDNHRKENANIPIKYNEFITNIGKSLKHTFRMISNDETTSTIGIDKTASRFGDSGSNALNVVTETDQMNSTIVANSSLTDRLRTKLRTGLKLFKDSKMTLSTNRPLYEEEWFHGVLPREEVVRLLKSEGDFLVRETIRNDESQIVLSVCWNGHKHFIVQTTNDGHYRFEGPGFPSIQELIRHQHLSELPVTGRSGAVLKRPVTRELWELSNDDVILLDKIGRGNFGDVYKARLKSSKNEVAVKTCRMTLPDEQKRKFLQEGRILKQYDHPNIVKLIGICVQKQPIMIVMELVAGGSLLSFLRKNSATLNTKQLMGMCRDAAAGMRYLESKNCIHRDLAARNCLIGYENIVKISDFGMSREEEEYIVSDGMKQIPIKWTAPEALNFGKYTSLCDVWSYGILVWEIFSKGDTPYAGMSNSRARERIDAGYRMPASECATPEIYRLMLACWSYEPEMRPHFDEIYSIVESLASRE